MTASLRVIDAFRRSGRNALRVLGASGQLGYGVPTPAFHAGLAREPDIIGCDMGSIDIGPYYLGAGRMATAPAATRRDLRKVIRAAQSPALTAPRIAALYGVAEGDVRVIPYPLGRAIKIVMPRRVTAGDPGDTDAYGAQQHGPLLGVEL